MSTTPSDQRPNPDTLLAQLHDKEGLQQRGRLKVFFGAAPGVGKTFAMLEEARARAAEGLDVVVGYAEPHIRTDTETLLLGMEILPYKIVEYKNTKLKEFDLDAALKRKPALLCVDELAHTNAPEMRHPKRWQDVTELLEAGINVYTTLNVQHLESANDIVQHITGIKVRETLPDSILEQADEVELVDTSPEELLERLSEGKVYTAEMAERAARNFFMKGNLLALRELALRQTAQRVDAQMDDFRRDNAVRETWPTSERILVCVGPSPLSARLVRAAKRLATGLKAEWIAAYVETPTAVSQADRQRIDAHLRLAEQLGAEPVTLSGAHVSEEIVAYAKRRNVTKIVIGKPMRSRLRDAVFGSVVDDLVRKSGDIDIHVIRGGIDESETHKESPPSTTTDDRRGYAWAVGLVIAVTAIAWPFYHGFDFPDVTQRPFLENTNVLMLYLLAVLWISYRYSRGAAILASILGVALFDFCFVPPYLTFTVADEQYIVTFLAMLITALVISTLTHRVRDQAEMSRERERRTASMFSLSRDLAVSRTTDEVAATTVKHIADVFGSKAVLLLRNSENQLTSRASSNGETRLDAKELGVAQWAFEHEQAAGAGTSTLPAAHALCIPLKSTRGAIGVVAIIATDSAAFGVERRQLADTFASHAALAIERALLAEEARQAWERVEAEFLRNTLLSGVSHDLRTPLAAITGAASALRESGNDLSPQNRKEMVEMIFSEAERMERLITNLLDMTRLESGGLLLKKEWQPVQEIIGSALHHLDQRLQGRQIKTHIPSDLPMIEADGTALDQVVSNLLDNAVEYTPPESPIDISASARNGEVAIEIADRGPGLPAGTEDRVFQKFFRIQHSTSGRGLGLGLAICQGIVHAHGGKITAANRPGGGAVFKITLPNTGKPPHVDSST